MMSSDVWERARRFVEEGERQQAEKDAVLAQYERVNIHGKVLVDGHHVFLEMLRDIDTFNHYLKEHPKFLRGIKNIWLDPHPVYVADATSDVIGLLQAILPTEVAQQFTGSEKMCISASVAARGLQEEASRYCAVESQSDILIFDARMPPVTNLIKELEEKSRVCLRQGFAPLDVERRLRLDRAGRWEFGADDGAPKELPYGFKNEFLNTLRHWSYGWKEHLGRRKFNVSKSGFHQKEKGVDARLVIAGCQAAVDPKLDWTCLVTNDADYVPLVEHFHSRGKVVYLLSLGDPMRQSGDLKNAVGTPYLINKVDLYNRFPAEPVPEPYRSKPALSLLRSHCVFVEVGARLGGEAERRHDPVKELEFQKQYDDIVLELDRLSGEPSGSDS